MYVWFDCVCVYDVCVYGGLMLTGLFALFYFLTLGLSKIQSLLMCLVCLLAGLF